MLRLHSPFAGLLRPMREGKYVILKGEWPWQSVMKGWRVMMMIIMTMKEVKKTSERSNEKEEEGKETEE